MPGPKYPQGYNRFYHQIMSKLVSERPAVLAVRTTLHPGHARATFNYFRQSWLRQYEFFSKQKSFAQADRAYDTYNRLMSYSVGIDGDRLIFTSKEIGEDIEFEMHGQAPQFFKNDSPMREEYYPNRKDKKKGEESLKTDFNEYINDTLKEAESVALTTLGHGKKSAPIIADNPLPTPQSKPTRAPATAEEHAFYLVYSRLPKSFEELDAFNKGEAIE